MKVNNEIQKGMNIANKDEHRVIHYQETGGDRAQLKLIKTSEDSQGITKEKKLQVKRTLKVKQEVTG